MQRRQLMHRGVVSALSMLWLNASAAIARAHPRAQVIGDGDEAILAAAGAVSPAAVPGYQLRLVRSEWSPDLPSPARTRSGARVACVGSGEFTVAIDIGSAVVWPAQRQGSVPAIRITPLDPPLVCHPDDCMAFDADTVATVLAAHSASDEPAVLWEACFSVVPLSRWWQCS